MHTVRIFGSKDAFNDCLSSNPRKDTNENSIDARMNMNQYLTCKVWSDA